jgi:rhodanese-related sulfurtransferase
MTLTVHELLLRLKSGQSIKIVDVRDPDEWKICQIPGAVFIPLDQLALRAEAELEPAQPIVVYCHHGIRSSRAQHLLQSRGFQHVYNLTGGIEDWAREIDPAMRRY